MFSAVVFAIALSAQSPSGAETTATASAGEQQEAGKPEGQDPNAQKKPDDSDARKPPTPEHTGLKALFGNLAGDFTHLPHKDNFIVAAVGGAAALAVHPWDDELNAHLRSHYDAVNRAFAPGKYIGSTAVQMTLSLGTFATGRAVGSDKASHFGMDLLRAQILSEAIVQPIKFATQRERPDGSNNLSFPSGHAAITFAGATVVARHLGWRSSAGAYAVASYVAASRLHDNVHHLSDVVFGSAIGIIAGRTVTQHGRSYWTMIPMPGGVGVVVNF